MKLMKRLPFKRHLVILGVCILAIGVIVPISTFAKGTPSGEQKRTHADPAIATAGTPTSITADCSSPQLLTTLQPGDVLNVSATLSTTDTNEPTESENLFVVDGSVSPPSTILFVDYPKGKLTGTRTATFTASVSNDPIQACIFGIDTDETGTVTFTVVKPLWGVDSSNPIGSKKDPSFYNSVKAAFGAPDFWGRYIGDNSHTAVPLNAKSKNGTPLYTFKDMVPSEVPFAHSLGLAILPIFFNYPVDAVNGKSTGQNYATLAIEAAQTAPGLVIPKGTAIFNDIEQAGGVNPDAAFIQGWYDTFNSTFTYTSPYDGHKYTYHAGYYKAGYYGNGTSTSRFATAYCSAVSAESEIAFNSFIWSSEPSTLRTSKTNAPPYGPFTPSCTDLSQAWQYAIVDSHGPPNVDTDEAVASLPLWHP